MGVKRLKPTTPSNRFAVLNTYAEITTNIPEKSLLDTIKKSGGRNNSGRMTVRYRGGGHKRKYRIIDFKRNKHGIVATVKSIEYDPNRTAFIALLEYADGELRYIIAPKGLKVGQEIISGENVAPEVGNALKIKFIPLGTNIHNIESRPGEGGVYAKSAGNYCQLLSRDGKYATIKMPSSESRKVLVECMATVGIVSNEDHSLVSLGKAGRKRWIGIRPRTRGVAMNPVDHPMGGGEGRASGGHPRSRNGLYAKGLKTRAKKNPTNMFIVERRKKK
jgi:large subunit ribosomal protein L2